ncbi:NUDIX hydrolase domain-like protein [Mycena pura]|uniref:NUDIX hydrolase domain-like protein n=1 Tax=Mycena pura TaxID=153505 RepID=A0AAD6V407_9AGAR|nr:NUDIX hydrolase domain-like protein [Mycena pura]
MASSVASEHVGKRLVIGVAIVRRLSNISLPQVLVLQGAAHETLFPNMYELPGGKCEPTDSDLLATVVRETLEETAFKVLRGIAEFPGFEYSTPKGSAQQFNFVVEVEGGAHKDPILDPNEHQAFAWVDEGNFKTFSMSDAMTLVVADALTAAKETMLEYSTESHSYSS